MNALVTSLDVPLTRQSYIGPGQTRRAPGLPYTGPAGRTRTERVRVFRVDREPVEVEVFRVVNVEEHPELRDAALGGTLHRLDDGELVDVSFVYHDPEAQQFALVIPDGASGRELSERAKLLDSLMKEQEENVPDYVRHFAIVYGRRGLASYVDESATMEVDITELEPLDQPPIVASYYPRLASLLPAAGFWAHSATELAPLVEDDELWIFVQVAADDQDAFTEASSDLLIQLKTVDQLPICILVLIDSRTHVVRRAYLDPARAADGRILELLRRDFHATIVVYSDAHRPLRSFRLEAPRASNARMIIGRAELAPQPPPERWQEAVESCRLGPPPVGQVDHPFVLEDDAATAAEALGRLLRLEAWSSPERVEEALMMVSVPRTVFELSRRRIVADALRFGLALSNTLVLQAVRFGLAPDAKALVTSLSKRFEEIVPCASAQGLDDGQIEENRKALERLSMLHGTSTGPALSCNMGDSG